MITTKNIPQFIEKKIKKELPFKIDKIISCEEVNEYSNNNYIWRIKLLSGKKERIIFLKQFRKYNKRAFRKGKKTYIDPERIKIEVKFIDLLKDLWGGKYVPEIFYYDPKNCIIVMSDVSRDKKILIEEFEKERVYPELGGLFGRLFGKLHGKTYGALESFPEIEEKKNTISWFFKNYLEHGIKKHVSGNKVDVFYKEVNKVPFSMVWGDAVYRNIFVNKKSFSLVDFDHAINYDPAIDCGILLSHWTWMMLKNDSKIKKDSEKFINDFLKSYTNQLKLNKISKKDIKAIIGRVFKWMGIYLVSRVDGRSGSYFKKWPKWEERIRKNGIALFKWEDCDIVKNIKL